MKQDLILSKISIDSFLDFCKQEKIPNWENMDFNTACKALLNEITNKIINSIDLFQNASIKPDGFIYFNEHDGFVIPYSYITYLYNIINTANLSEQQKAELMSDLHISDITEIKLESWFKVEFNDFIQYQFKYDEYEMTL